MISVPEMTRAEGLLTVVLRILSVPLLLAFPCAVLPDTWMNTMHEWLGLGTLPDAPIVEYLARSASLLYGFHGLLLLLIATDVRRYLPIIWLMSGAGVAFGVAMMIIDHVAGLPVYWRWMEGGFIVAESLVLLMLTWRVRLATRTAEGTH